MGHLGLGKADLWEELRLRLDRTQAGLPKTPEIYEILKHLYDEEEAAIAIKMPIVPRKLSTVVRRTGIPEPQLRPKLERMAEKGLVFDFHHPRKGDYYMLSPAVVGFFEMSLMRVRSDIDQKAVARLLYLYVCDRSEFQREMARGNTPIGRALVREEALRDEVESDVLPYERAVRLIEESTHRAIGLCYCRHKAEHNGHACEAPQDLCFMTNKGAEFAVRRGHARAVEVGEMLEKLAIAKEAGLVQISDNVRQEPFYICNCCGCCCGQLAAINRHGIAGAVNTSNFLATIDEARCNGCGKCAKACPIQAISLRPRAPHLRAGRKGSRHAVVDEEICLGCGVCHPRCAHDALTMEPRERRVLTPENTFERVLRQAIGRGTLHDLLFDEHDGPRQAFLNNLVGAIEAMPVTRRVAVNETLKSRFVDFLIRNAKKTKKAPPEVV